MDKRRADPTRRSEEAVKRESRAKSANVSAPVKHEERLDQRVGRESVRDQRKVKRSHQPCSPQRSIRSTEASRGVVGGANDRRVVICICSLPNMLRGTVRSSDTACKGYEQTVWQRTQGGLLINMK
jgi:hypothetical protein